ncbi:GNAT family N-acetyltransferase [Acidimicrobiaceae bacterium AH-315-P05]|nr:GNAT family N-acetyltransferase [Acidimicrobiaceae bacterium AH-315-P05]
MAETPELNTERLSLEPLRVEHSDEMAAVLSSPVLYEFTGGHPPTPEELVARYRLQIAGSTRSGEQWHNWIARNAATGEAVGFVQATVVDNSADVAWLIGLEHQRQGFGAEATRAMIAWLERQGIDRFSAHIHPRHRASSRLATAIGFGLTESADDDGEEIWVRPPE